MTAVAAAGNMVTANAKAEKGQVFAGWYIDAERTVPYASGGADYRTAQMSYAPDETDALFARFATEAEDKESIDFDLSLNPFYNSNAELSIPLSGAVKSLSLPTLTVANLPTGVRYDAKTLSLTGTPTKPGETKDVEFTIKNLSNKAGEVFTKTFKIGDAQAASLPGLHYNDANGYPAFTPGATVDMANVLGTATMATLAEGGWAVTGLPAGMTFNSKDGTFKGAPTAANTSYLVTFRKGNEMATITMRTGELPKLVLEAVVSENGILVIDEEVSRQVRLTGAGAYAANKAVTLSATAPKGYVFAGWYQGGTVPVENGKQDFRTASGFGYTMPSVDTTLTAKFIRISKDYASVNDMQFTVSLAQGESMPAGFIRNAIWSESFPTVTVKGLPAGIKFDAKSLLLSGAATDKTPKWYDLVVSVKNAGGYTYTGIFGVSVNGGEPVADVDELGLGSTLDWLDNLKVGGIVEDESSFGTSEDGVTGVTIAPAMPEIKIYKESDDGETIFLVDEINGEMPVVKTPGVYTVTVSGRVDGKAAKTTKRFIVRDNVSLYERVQVADGCEAMGTVTGDGTVVHPGANFTINATPKAGYVFAGWYADSACEKRAYFVPEIADYRKAQQTGIISTDTVDLYLEYAVEPSVINPTTRYAKFIKKGSDTSIEIVDLGVLENTASPVYNFSYMRDPGGEICIDIQSDTLPTITFKNLPTWMDKDGWEYLDGFYLWYNEKSEPDPGEYSFTVTAKNVGGATAEKTFTIKVDNYRNQSLALDYENGYTLVTGASFDMAMAMPDVDLTGWTVTGLPAGMTFKNGVISGAPTAPDKSYTVWFKKAGEETATVTMRTKPYPQLVLEAEIIDPNETYPELGWGVPIPDEAQFKLTGAGNYQAGKVVTLGATAPTDWVFAGWKDETETAIEMLYPNVDSNSNDTRVAAYKLTMPTADVTTLKGVFIHKMHDYLVCPGAEGKQFDINPNYDVGDEAYNSQVATCVRYMFMSVTEHGSFPTVTAKGLPAGMKFDAKNLLLSGKVTAPSGYYYATFTGKNLSGYTLTVPVMFAVQNKNGNPLPSDVVDTMNGNYFGVDSEGGVQFIESLKANSISVGQPLAWETSDSNWDYVIPDDWQTLGMYDKFDAWEWGITSVSGLPTGLTLVTERESSSSGTYINYGIEGCPSTPGWFKFSMNAKDGQGNDGRLEFYTAVQDCISRYVEVRVVAGEGTVTGGGVWNSGKKYDVKATAKAGYEFAGWYLDSKCAIPAQNWTLDSECDYRVAAQKWTLNSIRQFEDDDIAGPVLLYAKFVPKTEASGVEVGLLGAVLDSAPIGATSVEGSFAEGNLVWTLEPKNYYVEAALGLKIISDTLPKVSVKGLPKGFELAGLYADGLFPIDGYINIEENICPEPGDYPITMTVTANGKTQTFPFTIRIGHYHSWEMDQAGLQTAYSLDVGAASDDWLTALGITGDLTSGKTEDGFSWTWSVTGLPKGLTFNKTTGKITGTLAAVTADTTSIVHIKKTSSHPGSGSWTEEATTAITVKALPSWVVGTFYGICYVDDWPNGIEIKVAASGAVTATIVDVDARVTVKATNVYRDGENFCFDFSQSQANGDHSSGHVIISKSLIDEAAQTPLGCLSGTEEGEDEDGDPYNCEWIAYQDAYVAKPAGVVLPTFAASDSTLQIPVNEPLYGTLTLKFGANGVVTPAWSGDGKFAMFAAHMTPFLVTDDIVHAYVWVMGYNSAYDEAIGFNVTLQIPVSANGTANASEVDADIEYAIFGD